MSYKQRKQQGYELPVRRQSPQGLQGKRGQKRYSDPGIKFAKQMFAGRSERSKGQDLVRLAQIAPDVTVWLKDPSRWDLKGVDMPQAERIFENRTARQKAADLAKRAKLTKDVELWMGNINRLDMKGVDSPPKGKHIRRFRVMPKEEGKKLELKRAETKKTEEKKHTLPSTEQIIERAQQIHMEKAVKEGLPTISAEPSELRESGEFEEARAELMRGEKSKADIQIEEYVHNLNSELEPLGFQVVPV
jgi:hypothetical protein